MPHSKGPFLVSSTFLVCDAEARVLANCMPMVDVPMLAPTYKEAEANTVMFGAAPDMLEALQVVEKYLKGRVRNTNGEGETKILPMLNAVIKKATTVP